MHQRQSTNLAASVRQRLYNLARGRGDELQLVLTRHGVERRLYRLAHTQKFDGATVDGRGAEEDTES